MKRIIILLFVMFVCLNAYADERKDNFIDGAFGVKIMMGLNEVDNLNVLAGISFNKYYIENVISIEPAILFKTEEIEEGRLIGLIIPIIAKIYFHFGNIRPYIFSSAAAGYYIDSDDWRLFVQMPGLGCNILLEDGNSIDAFMYLDGNYPYIKAVFGVGYNF